MQTFLPTLLQAGLVASSRIGLPWSLASHPCSGNMALSCVLHQEAAANAIEPRMNSLPAPLLSLAHVTVMRGDCAALQDMNLEIACGEHVCILGRERWDIFELRSLLGIVSPDLLASCTTDATGRDVVLSGFFSSTRIFPHHHPDPKLLARAEETLWRLGVGHLADRAVAEMSSGEAKRTLIARALVHNPQTLLFDEPSNALDIGSQIQC